MLIGWRGKMPEGKCAQPIGAPSTEYAWDPRPLRACGIDDALSIARMLGSFKNIETFLLDPEPMHLRYLPKLLAEALGAERVTLPSEASSR